MSNNLLPSQMLRVPTPLVDAVKELSRLHRAGCTSIILNGLRQLIAEADSNIDISVDSSHAGIDSASIAKMISIKLEPLQTHLEQIDRRLQLVESTNESALISTANGESQELPGEVEDAIAMPLDDLASKAGEEEVVGEPVIEEVAITNEPEEETNTVLLEEPVEVISLPVATIDPLAEEAIALPVDESADESASEAGEEEVVGEPALKQTGEDREVAPQYLTRVQLGDLFGITRQAISKWSVDKLAENGWELVPGTGGRKNLPRYRPITQPI